MRRHHGRLRSLYKQREQVGVAALGDAAKLVLAAAGVLSWGEPDPGAELGAVLELLEVAHCGDDSRSRDRPDAQQRGDGLHRRADLGMSSDALITSGQMLVEFVPLRLGALQRQARQRAEFVVGVLQHFAQDGLQLAGLLRERETELQQQATDAVDACSAVGLDAFAQPVHAQHALLLDALDGDEAHART